MKKITYWHSWQFFVWIWNFSTQWIDAILKHWTKHHFNFFYCALRIKPPPSPWLYLLSKHKCTWKIAKVLTSSIKNVRISKQKLFCRGEEIRRSSPPIPQRLNLNCAAVCCTWCLLCQCSDAEKKERKEGYFNASIYQSNGQARPLAASACCTVLKPSACVQFVPVSKAVEASSKFVELE